MDTETSKVMFALLRSAVCGVLLSNEEISLYSPDILPAITSLAQKHDVMHLIVFALKKNRLLDESNKNLESKMLTAVYWCEKLKYELTKLCAALEQSEIPFIPLKGSVLRQYYPEPWMRTSCDIDVLVHEEDLQRVVSYLSDNLGYRRESQNSHDISMFTQGGVHIEVHYKLVENSSVNSAETVLKRIWSVAVKRDGCNYQYEMPDEMFYFYHIAHMAKHFVSTGGCGIRPFLDLWVLNHRIDFDREKRDKLLSDGGLSVFAKQAELLSEVWFGNTMHTEITRQMEEYILRGGDTERRPIEWWYSSKNQKHKWLTPIMEVRRWGKLIFCGHLKRTVNELKYNSAISEDAATKAQALLKNVGL